jgi:hypothetical protein
MAFDTTNIVTAHTVYSSTEVVENLAAGKRLKVETSPAGAELVNETVPAGKKWHVIVRIEVHETDA